MTSEPIAERPYMPGYGLEGATKPPGEAMPWSRVQQLLESARNYWVCTVRPDGRPHTVPVWALWMDGRIFFSTGPRTRKAKNMAANPQVVVHVEVEDAAIIVEGRAEEITDREVMERFAAAYGPKYDWPVDVGFLAANAFIAVRPRTILTFAENLGDTATRWRFPAA